MRLNYSAKGASTGFILVTKIQRRAHSLNKNYFSWLSFPKYNFSQSRYKIKILLTIIKLEKKFWNVHSLLLNTVGAIIRKYNLKKYGSYNSS